jgi:DNA-binding CsgD family transcriptional regulator
VFYGKREKYTRRARRVLREYDDPREEIRRALWVAKKALSPGESLTIGRLAWRLEADNRPLRLMKAPDLDKAREAVKAAREALADLVPGTPEYEQAEREFDAARERLRQARQKRAIAFPGEDALTIEGDPRALAAFSELENRLVLDSFAEQDIFTPTQLEILSLFLKGLTSEQIAQMRRVKRSCVYVHLRDIREAIRHAEGF